MPPCGGSAHEDRHRTNQARDVPPALVPAWAAQAERAGFSSLGSVGRISYPGVMDTVALASAAGATASIGLISAILIGSAWPPVLLAKEVVRHRRRLGRPRWGSASGAARTTS